jgi:hypothetical protein
MSGGTWETVGTGQLAQTAEQADWKIAVSTPYATTIDNTFATQPARSCLPCRTGVIASMPAGAATSC